MCRRFQFWIQPQGISWMFENIFLRILNFFFPSFFFFFISHCINLSSARLPERFDKNFQKPFAKWPSRCQHLRTIQPIPFSIGTKWVRSEYEAMVRVRNTLICNSPILKMLHMQFDFEFDLFISFDRSNFIRRAIQFWLCVVNYATA